MKEKQTFSLVSDIDNEKTCFFFYFKINTPYEKFLIFLSFMSTFSEAAVRRCS